MTSIRDICDEVEKTYIVTPNGECINKKRGSKVIFPIDMHGYKKGRLWCPNLSKNKDQRIPFRMHRLVALFYLKDFDSALQVNHKNGVRTDNRVENLEMVTASQNVWHGWNVLDSTERRKKVSRLRSGAVHSKETKEKIRIAHLGLATGRKHSEETRQKMRESWERRKVTKKKLPKNQLVRGYNKIADL